MKSMDRGRARAACQQTGREGNEEETRYCAVVAAKATRTGRQRARRRRWLFWLKVPAALLHRPRARMALVVARAPRCRPFRGSGAESAGLRRLPGRRRAGFSPRCWK